MKPERYHRLRAVLERRQPDLTVLMEGVHKPHNFSAILRNCDAVGVLEAHAIPAGGELPLHKSSSAGTHKWLQVHEHPDLDTAVSELRSRDLHLWAAHPTADAVDYREADFTRPTCIMVGAELHGLSPRALEIADDRVAIPMMGMVRSLNVSVATALLLFEALRQRQESGLYERSRLTPERLQRLLFEWGYPRVARLLRERDEAYPPLDDEGEIIS